MSSRYVGPIIKTVLFIIFAPGTLLMLIPWLLLGRRVPEPQSPLHWLAIAPLVIGASFLLRSAWDFAVVGHGTPAPTDPPKTLVVTGLYRYVRNPMYVGVGSGALSESLLFSSRVLLEYALIYIAGFTLFVLAYEEPALRRKFGDSYRAYCRAVPRWIPRLTPWQQEK